MDARKLLETLQELKQEEIESFKWQLRQRDNFVGGLRPLKAAALEDARNRELLVNLIIETYTNNAQEIVMKVLREMGKRDLADELANIPNLRCGKTSEYPGNSFKSCSGKLPRSTQATGLDTSGKTVDEQYELNSKPTGLCVIMNNENFKDDKDKRNGTDKDAGDLARTFSLLGFRVLMCKDQTKSQMQESLKRFSSKDLTELQGSSVKEWSGWAFTDLNVNDVPKHGDAFVCCIMSHGDEGCVLGTDMESLPIKDITKTFNGQNCNVLVGKPKVFFIQACRDKEKIQPGIAADSIPELQEDAPVVKLIPVDADFLVAMATVENCVSFRHTTDGSWFMQSVCKQLEEGCHSGDDLSTILLRVNNDVSQKVVKFKNKNAIQMPEQKVTLRKKLVFSPMSN